MSENRKRILEMLADKKITVDEAERLLAATGEKTEMTNNNIVEETIVKKMPKFLRVQVEPGPDATGENVDKVNVRVPMSLIRAGMKLTSLIPPQATDKMNEAMREKGIDFDLKNLKPEDLEELIEAMSDLEVEVDGATKVRVFAE
ncbi:MAG: hypothetical protein JW712_10145 [Dehalococcoidales bacterium]|nr:hypothetical protein [Dehalococcoidales bacterium]